MPIGITHDHTLKINCIEDEFLWCFTASNDCGCYATASLLIDDVDMSINIDMNRF